MTLPSVSDPDAENRPAGPKALAVWCFEIGGEEFALLSCEDAELDIPPALTRAEAEVARLAIHGHSNQEIAARRKTSPRTVANQVASLFGKLGIGSRRELVARLGQRVGKRR